MVNNSSTTAEVVTGSGSALVGPGPSAPFIPTINTASGVQLNQPELQEHTHTPAAAGRLEVSSLNTGV